MERQSGPLEDPQDDRGAAVCSRKQQLVDRIGHTAGLVRGDEFLSLLMEVSVRGNQERQF